VLGGERRNKRRLTADRAFQRTEDAAFHLGMKVDVARHRDHRTGFSVDRLLSLKVYDRKGERTLMLYFPRIASALTASVRVKVKCSATLGHLRCRLRLLSWSGLVLDLRRRRSSLLKCQTA
jgi:hypothetical protein